MLTLLSLTYNCISLEVVRQTGTSKKYAFYTGKQKKNHLNQRKSTVLGNAADVGSLTLDSKSVILC